MNKLVVTDRKEKGWLEEHGPRWQEACVALGYMRRRLRHGNTFHLQT